MCSSDLTYLVRRAKPRPFRRVARGVAGIQTRTVGREEELNQLQAAYEDAFDHRRVVWAQLVGEAGVGKSRLLEDISDWIELRPEIVRFFRYALGSLGEVQDDLCECTARRVIDQAQFDRLWDLSEHTKATALKFMKSHQKDQGTRSGRPNRKHVARRTSHVVLVYPLHP